MTFLSRATHDGTPIAMRRGTNSCRWVRGGCRCMRASLSGLAATVPTDRGGDRVGRRIGGKGGGSDKGTSATGLAVAAMLGLVLAGGATGGSGLLGGSGGAGVSGSSGSSAGIRAQARIGKQNSRRAHSRIIQQGARVIAEYDHGSSDCAAHAYGELIEFFRATPCVGVHRAVFELRDQSGAALLLAVAWVEMPDTATASTLKTLVDRHGTGNVVELSRERGRHRNVRYSGDIYDSAQDGTIVVNAQLQPVAGGPAGRAASAIAAAAIS